MDDYTRMRRRLERMSEDDFYTLMSEFWSIEVAEVDGRWIEICYDSQGCGGTRPISIKTWRKESTESLLATREEKKSEWNRLCHHVRVDSDSAYSTRLARFAIVLSLVALAGSSFPYLKELIVYLRR